MNFLTLFSKMIVLFAFVGVGFLCEKLGFIDDHSAKTLNKLVIHVCAPCLIIHSVLGSELTYEMGDILMLIVYGVVYNSLTLAVAFIMTAVYRPKTEDRRTYRFIMCYSNCVFMGYPIIAAVFGNDAVFLASVCCIPYNIFLYCIGVVLLCGKGSGTKEFFKRLFNPAFFATILSLCIFFLDLNVAQPIADVFSYLGNMVVPLALMLIGVSLGSMSFKSIFSDLRVYLLCFGRLIAAPLVVRYTLGLFIHEPLFLNLFTIFSVMPCASVSPIFCTEYGGDSALASKSVFMSTLIALITVPALLSLLMV